MLLIHQGANLQNFNTELVRSLEDITERRSLLLAEVKKDEERKADYEKMIFKIKEELIEVKSNFKLFLTFSLFGPKISY